MTEQEYITATDYAKISSARQMLMTVIPQSSVIIELDEYRKMIKYLADLEESHSYNLQLKLKQ